MIYRCPGACSRHTEKSWGGRPTHQGPRLPQNEWNPNSVAEPLVHNSRHDALQLPVSQSEAANHLAFIRRIHKGNSCEAFRELCLPGRTPQIWGGRHAVAS
jgi:hypothetical protein